MDSVDTVDWEETKDEIRELRTPVIQIRGGSRKGGTQACEIQALAGQHLIRQTEKSSTLDLKTFDRIKRIKGDHASVGDHRIAPTVKYSDIGLCRRRRGELGGTQEDAGQ